MSLLRLHVLITLTPSRLCSVRVLALGKAAKAQALKQSSGPANAYFTDGHFVAAPNRPEVEAQCLSLQTCHCARLTRGSDNSEALFDASEEIADSALSLVDMTRQIVMSDDPSLSQHVISLYKKLGEQQLRLQRLKSWIGRTKYTKNEHSIAASQSEASTHENAVSDSNSQNTKTRDSCAVDIFFDCVSRFSCDDSASSIDTLNTKFSGSLDYYLERSPSFYVEQYMGEGLFTRPVFVFNMTQPPGDYQNQKYFLLYAETPRRWHRIIVSVIFSSIQQQSSVLRAADIDNMEFHHHVLPGALQNLLLNTILSRMDVFYSVTILSMFLREDESDQIIIDSHKIEAAEDQMERGLSDQAQVLQDIEDLGCTKIPEREVMVLSRISSTCFKALVRSRICVEQKVPFATASKTRYRDYFEDLKLLHSFRDCSGVVQFIGVVLGQTSHNITSYLYELPLIESLQTFVGLLSFKSKSIPWPIKESWVRQIVQAISYVHEKGVVVGLLSLHSFAVRADGTAVFSRIGSPRRRLEDRYFNLPPELRHASRAGASVPQNLLNFRTDIFLLGCILWQLAEEKAKNGGYFCNKYGCTQFPRHLCKADHTRPISLPACGDHVPAYFNDIIRQCRLPDPKTRPPARKLSEILSNIGEVEKPPLGVSDLLETCSSEVEASMRLYCAECGTIAMHIHYHCYICHGGDFDICQSCFTRGVPCCNPEHRLIKRVTKDGTIVDET